MLIFNSYNSYKLEKYHNYYDDFEEDNLDISDEYKDLLKELSPIKMPTLIISKWFGEMLKDAINEQGSKVIISINFQKSKPIEKLKFEYWTSADYEYS